MYISLIYFNTIFLQNHTLQLSQSMVFSLLQVLPTEIKTYLKVLIIQYGIYLTCYLFQEYNNTNNICI